MQPIHAIRHVNWQNMSKFASYKSPTNVNTVTLPHIKQAIWCNDIDTHIWQIIIICIYINQLLMRTFRIPQTQQAVPSDDDDDDNYDLLWNWSDLTKSIILKAHILQRATTSKHKKSNEIVTLEIHLILSHKHKRFIKLVKSQRTFCSQWTVNSPRDHINYSFSK